MRFSGWPPYNGLFARLSCLKLLALDTSTRSTVLGLKLDGELIDRTTGDVRTHSRDILPAIVALVAEAGIELTDLDAIVFGQGPGSFTGLRIAVGVVQGLGYGLDIPAVPVSSMRCLAQSIAGQDGDRVFVALEAREEEIYFGAYGFQSAIASPLGAEGVLDVSELLPLPSGSWTGIGNAWDLQQKIEQATGVEFREIRAQSVPDVRDLVRLGEHDLQNGVAVSALEAAPVYLREQVAAKPGAS